MPKGLFGFSLHLVFFVLVLDLVLLFGPGRTRRNDETKWHFISKRGADGGVLRSGAVYHDGGPLVVVFFYVEETPVRPVDAYNELAFLSSSS